jgi:chemotaxis protein methyltransferase CheR
MSPPEGFEAVTTFVEENLEFATSHYNDSYLQRRIKSRMRRTETDDYVGYLDLLESDADEHARLLEALSINVTGFFRNPEVWDGIRDVLRMLSEDHRSIRVWSAACADGREPYSLSMLAMDDDRVDARMVTVHATDINDRALRLAREGAYESNHTSDLDEQLRYLSHYPTYVDRDGEQFTVGDNVRERVSFETHDLIRDDVEARYELVVCRNLFIYIDPEFKKRVMDNILDALRPGGYLVIGKAETLPQASSSEFAVFDSRKRIYERV